MSKRTLLAAAIVAIGTPELALAQNDSWFPVAMNDKRIATSWVQLNSYETLNENSFRLNAKFTNDRGNQIVGRVDINCKNKDFYFRPNGVLVQRGPWAAIPAGSGIESIANYFCKRTAAKTDWGYTEDTMYLWEQAAPIGNASDAKGDWILVTETDEAETYYNTAVDNKGTHLLVAMWYRAKKGERPAAIPADTQGYLWINVDCKSNAYSVFFKPDKSVGGTWMAPTAGRPGGVAMTVKKKFCKGS